MNNPADTPDLDPVQELINMNNLILQAEEDGRTDDIAQYLHPNFTIVRASGVQQDLETFLKAVPSNVHRGRSADSPEVRLYGNSAIVTGRVHTSQYKDGTPATGHYRNTRVFVRENGHWQCVSWQVTEIREQLDAIIHFPAAKLTFKDIDAERMCGDGRLEALEGVPASPHMRAVFVRFQEGGHTKWHRHEGEQVLYATEGSGFVQLKGQEEIALHEGDRAYIPERFWHRHGAVPDESFVHFAITVGNTEWQRNDPCDQ
jgi:quercetin dioxygenase-like cupin family protein